VSANNTRTNGGGEQGIPGTFIEASKNRRSFVEQCLLEQTISHQGPPAIPLQPFPSNHSRIDVKALLMRSMHRSNQHRTLARRTDMNASFSFVVSAGC
jgi:hypothetical protein